MTAAERAREVSGPCFWKRSDDPDCRCPTCILYGQLLGALLAHEAEVRSEVERECAEFYDSRRGDLSLWSTEPTPARVTGNASVVFSIRFLVDELEEVRQAAARGGKTVSDLIRTIVLEAIARHWR